VSNDLLRESRSDGIDLQRVRITVRATSRSEQLDDLVAKVDDIAEIPNTLCRGTSVKLGTVRVG
jgi:hypothetical protein